jgi:signal transduction histidine kinase
MTRRPHSASIRYLASALSVVAALTLTLTARSLFATTAYSLFLAAVMFSSWYGGLTPGLLAILFSLLALDRYFVSPELSGVLSRDDLVHLSVFLLVAGIINHLNRSKMHAEEKLLESHNQLQSEVSKRTEDLQQANDALRRLSGELMQLQDEERRRMARLLHETVAQSLAALKMDLAVIKRDSDKKNGEEHETTKQAVILEAVDLTEECIRDVRTLSYEAGLSSALQWYISGFEKRSGIKTRLDVPSELGRLPRNIETAIFRIVQECLTNIHRHAGSPDAQIHIHTTTTSVVVEVTDHGRGMPVELHAVLGGALDQFGVGIMGLCERVKQFGGHMEIHSAKGGTTVMATLPHGEPAYV